MRSWQLLVGLGVLALGTVGCGPVLHTEMLGVSIQTFAARMKTAPTAKIWITSPVDSVCDAGCGCAAKGEKKSVVGGLFSRGPSDGSSAYDRLAYEVFANYLTSAKRVRVVETHRHNYSTELNPETHKKVEVVEGTTKVSTTSCEELCLLDEAKKRKADKVLVYEIQDMENDKMTIHFRLSDVVTGVVEISQTMKIENLRSYDHSYGARQAGGARSSAPAGAEPLD